MAGPIKVIHCGLGPIGQRIARLVLETPGLKPVGATDPAPHLSGQDLGKVLDLERRLRVKVDPDPARFVKKARADVAILCTGSSLKAIRGQIADLVARRMNVVTTCEELAYPTAANLSTFRQLDRLARRYKVSVLGTGVNPGYAMDALAITLTAPCARVERVSATRVVDAGTRRLPLQRKVGAGLNLSQFRRAVNDGSVRHHGLVESAQMIAAGLGWKLARVEETIEPAIAPRDLETEHLRIPAGAAAGIKQAVRGYRGNDLAVSLDLHMYVGAERPRDHVLIGGTPAVDMTIERGVAGDEATAAMVVNSIPAVLGARAGVVTMLDLPLPRHISAEALKQVPSRKPA
jgi:4-hydroxy-tetrahydrodipicolinate reductase